MTLQTFGVAFCSFLLGARVGVSATVLYLALGAVGLPVFAGFGGSLAFLVGPTGGFLVGFLPLSFFCGIGARRKTRLGALLSAWIGLTLCHLGGVLWFAHVSAVSPVQAFLLSSLPYIIKDILFIALARAAAKRVKIDKIFRKETP
jgi:biotin transport system substrate-specific component